MKRDCIAFTLIMLFTLYFIRDIFSTAAEYFSISKSHHDNEEGISERLQCIRPESGLQRRKERDQNGLTDCPTYSNFTEHAFVVYCAS